MKLNKINFFEKFAIVTFPIALAVGCTSTADQEYQAKLNTGQVMQKNGRDLLKEEYSSSLNTSSANSKGTTETMQTQVSTMNIKSEENAHIDGEILRTTANNDYVGAKLKLPESEVPVIKTQLPEQGIFYFKTSKYEVTETDHKVLRQHAEYLKENTNMILYVDGFSDNRGSPHINYLLSKKRAEHIANLLIGYGAPQSRIKVNGYGESFPLTSEKNWDENRRVELEYGYAEPDDGLYATLN